MSHSQSRKQFVTPPRQQPQPGEYESNGGFLPYIPPEAPPRYLSGTAEQYNNDMMIADEQRQDLHVDDEKPPPPPAHRSRHNSPNGHEMVLRSSMEPSPRNPPMRHDVLRHEAHRYSMAGPSTGRPIFRGYDSAPAPDGIAHFIPEYPQPHQRTHSFDCSYDEQVQQARSMQPTVEDVPESPMINSTAAFQTNSPRVPPSHFDQEASPQYPDYPENPSPAPLSLRGRDSGSVASGHFSTPARQIPQPAQQQPPAQPSYELVHRGSGDQDYDSSFARRSGGSYEPYHPPTTAYQYHGQSRTGPAHYDESLHTISPAPSSEFLGSYDPQQGRSPELSPRRSGEYDYDQEQALVHIPSRGLHQVPSALVPGLDPALARENSDRIYEDGGDRRFNPNYAVTPTRGRQRTDSYPQYDHDPSHSPGHSPGYSPGRSPGHSPGPYTPSSYDERQYSQSPGMEDASSTMQRNYSRNTSPNPISHSRTNRIPRKSISPAPSHASFRAGNIPFSPDSYDSLNPSMGTSTQVTTARPEPSAKILDHDGREIDPSDHLPVESWAPEPEPRPRADEQPRQTPSGAQPMPAPRRQLRLVQRPQSIAGPPSQGFTNDDHRPPPAAGRNRLQKKQHRPSASQGASPGGSPLAPISSNKYQDAGIPRTSTWDYPSENAVAAYGSSPGSSGALVHQHRHHHHPHASASGPPVPAKVPFNDPEDRPGADDWALMEELRNIDLGAGRSRRHRGAGYGGY